MTCKPTWEISASMVLGESLVITHLVPLVTLGGSKDHKMIKAASFNDSKSAVNQPSNPLEIYQHHKKSMAENFLHQ